MAGAHFVAIHSAKREVEGTEANSAVNSVAPPVGEEIMVSARENSVFHSSSVGASVPGYEERATSILLILVGMVTFFVARRVNDEPMAKRLDLDPPDRMLPETDIVGSIRMERIVYISRIMGSALGPPTNGDDSGYRD